MDIKKEIKLVRINTTLRVLRFADKYFILRTIDKKQVQSYRTLLLVGLSMFLMVSGLGMSGYLTRGWLLLMYAFLIPSLFYSFAAYRMKAVFIIKPLTRFYWEERKKTT